MNTTNARKTTNAIIQLADDGAISWETIARECLSYMSESDVADMCNTAGFIEEPEEEEEEEEEEE